MKFKSVLGVAFDLLPDAQNGIYLTKEGHRPSGWSFSEDEAKRLRDELNNRYPEPQAQWQKSLAQARAEQHHRDSLAYQALQLKGRWQEVTVDPKGAGHTYRLEVPGGWLYRTTTYRYPERHKAMEDGIKLLGEKGFIVVSGEKMGKSAARFWRGQAMEIVSQTTVFVEDKVVVTCQH